MCVCVRVCVVYIYIERERERERLNYLHSCLRWLNSNNYVKVSQVQHVTLLVLTYHSFLITNVKIINVHLTYHVSMQLSFE